MQIANCKLQIATWHAALNSAPKWGHGAQYSWFYLVPLCKLNLIIKFTMLCGKVKTTGALHYALDENSSVMALRDCSFASADANWCCGRDANATAHIWNLNLQSTPLFLQLELEWTHVMDPYIYIYLHMMHLFHFKIWNICSYQCMDICCVSILVFHPIFSTCIVYCVKTWLSHTLKIQEKIY